MLDFWSWNSMAQVLQQNRRLTWVSMIHLGVSPAVWQIFIILPDNHRSQTITFHAPSIYCIYLHFIHLFVKKQNILDVVNCWSHISHRSFQFTDFQNKQALKQNTQPLKPQILSENYLTPTHQPFPEHKKGARSALEGSWAYHISAIVWKIYKDSLFSCQLMTEHQYYNI